eukprot:TRINITY_DN27120_c0_g1_i1.p1 TRINITY_DN27120_c0_g1~~TRINITY_DN27120_c0_g1_i1.p1  ORF type:complete len:119 (+),score=14.67 TRINITY_DN27120_c0_g1_i1:121-477(+)
MEVAIQVNNHHPLYSGDTTRKNDENPNEESKGMFTVNEPKGVDHTFTQIASKPGLNSMSDDNSSHDNGINHGSPNDSEAKSNNKDSGGERHSHGTSQSSDQKPRDMKEPLIILSLIHI